MKEVHVVVWGLGAHARNNILPAIAACPGVTLAGVCSRNDAVRRQVAADLACAEWKTPDGMLESPRVDVIYLSTPIGLHVPQGLLALEAGKHLWCEKPLGMNMREVDSLLSLSRDRGLMVGEGLMYLYHPQFQHLRDVLASGRLGAIRSLSCRFGIPPLEHPGFRLDPSLGGGAFLDVGVYPVSAMVALFPGPDPEILQAEISGSAGAGVDVNGRAVLGYGTGVRATLEWGINCAYRNEIDVWGANGSMVTERLFSKKEEHVPRFVIRDLHGNGHTEETTAANHFTAMIGAFRALIDDAAGTEQERIQVAKRAMLAERIRQKSTT